LGLVIAAAALAGAPAGIAQLPLTEPAPKARIAFVADGVIHTIAADGSERRRLTTPPGDQFDGDPAWAPDGGPIAFTRSAEGEDVAHVWLADPDGTDLRPLVAEPRRGRGELSPAWSPDGSRIAFARIRLGRDRIVTSIVAAAADGSDQHTVYSEAGGENDDVAFLYTPAWSPDGQRILFTRSREGLVGSGGAPSLHVVSATGGTQSLVARDARDGTWSPDGSRIAYSRVDTGRGCEGDCDFVGDIHVINADGSADTAVAKTPGDDAEPSWSGDGGWIAFHSDRNNAAVTDIELPPPELYAVRPDGSCLTWLTNGTALSSSPAYEPGAGLSADPGGCGPTQREPLVETDTRKVESFKTFPIWWLGRVTPDGLLLTGAEADRREALFRYADCGRFDPKDCGPPLHVSNSDLCAGAQPLREAGHRNSSERLARGALLSEWREDDFGFFELYTGRTWLEINTDAETPPPVSAVDALHRVGQGPAPGTAMPSARLPRTFWRGLTWVTAAHRRLKDVDAVAKRLRLKRREVKRRLELAKRLSELGVKRRLGCR
jgi:Tol biopolymer transport system component